MDGKIDLSNFLFQYVNIKDIYGKTYNNWFVDLFESAADNDDTEDSIGILPDKESNNGIGLNASEIRSIEKA